MCKKLLSSISTNANRAAPNQPLPDPPAPPALANQPALADEGGPVAGLDRRRRWLVSRRAFLLKLAGGSLAALFAPGGLGEPPDEDLQWRLLDAVQQQLFPSEPDAPGATEINALGYLRSVLQDPLIDAAERAFILQGVGWLDGLAQERAGSPFLDLDPARRDQVLRWVAASPAGENWLSSLILYLLEALLTDPVYGGNPDGIGWRWLGHVPGYPRPPADKVAGKLAG